MANSGCGLPVVVNPSLRWGKPSGGGTKSTNRKLAEVVYSTRLKCFDSLAVSLEFKSHSTALFSSCEAWPENRTRFRGAAAAS